MKVLLTLGVKNFLVNFFHLLHIADIVFLVAELFLVGYLLKLYTRYRSFGKWSVIFLGITFLLFGTIIQIATDLNVISGIIKDSQPYIHVFGFIVFVWGIISSVSLLLHISQIDFITTTYTKRYIENSLMETLTSHKKEQKMFSIAFVDIDNFKQINDTHSHEIGDVLLNRVAVVMKETIRSEDKIGRYGGDEFMLIFKDTGYEETEVVMNRCRKAINEDIQLKKYSVEISVGIALYPIDADNVHDLSLIADDRMYADKKDRKRNVLNLV